MKHTCEIQSNGDDVFVVFDGLRIAKRGRPGTPQANTWVSIEPGYKVVDIEEGREIEIRLEDAQMH